MKALGKLILSLCLGALACCCAGAARAQNENQNPNTNGTSAIPSADSAADAAATARLAMQKAAELQRQPEFQDQIKKERQSMAGLAGHTLPKPGIDLGALGAQTENPPSPAAIVQMASRPTQQWSETNRQPPLLMVSFSMPDADLRELARQAGRIGAPMVLRGLVDNSFPATENKLRSFGDIPGASFMIDPTLYRRFHVESVPTFILPLETLKTCSKQDCAPPAHVRVSGESGIDHILDEIERKAKDPRAQPLVVQLRAMLEVPP